MALDNRMKSFLRLLNLIDQGGGPRECWPWIGYTDPDGYGKCNLDGKITTSHRAVYQLVHNTRLPPEIEIIHSCDNPPCCNPSHLIEGSHYDNMRDMVTKGRARGSPGEKNPKSKLKEEQVKKIRDLYRTRKFTYNELAIQFGVSKSLIAGIVKRVVWKHIP